MKNINRFASLNVMRIAEEILRDGNSPVIKELVSALTAASEYEYVITDGGKPEGEGWEKSPYSDNPNSYRREKGRYHDAPKRKSELREELQSITYDDIPENAKKIMGKLIDAEKLDDHQLDIYTQDMMRDKSISQFISDDMDYYYLESNEAKLVKNFGDSSYERDSSVRRELSNIACQIMNAPPDDYSIDKTWDVDEETLENARKFILANQKAAYMTGLVDEDGYILAYRGTNGQIDSHGNYIGANCESWAVDPLNAFPEKNFIKAKIPVSRVIGCSLGNKDLYPCEESEITVNTAGLDLEIENLNANRQNEFYKIKSKEGNKVAEKIKENLLRLQGQRKENKNGIEDNRTLEQKKLDDYLKKTKNDKVSVSKDKETPSDILEILSEIQSKEIRLNVAKNQSTSTGTLEKLSDDKDEMIRRNVAGNSNTSEDILRKLSQDESWSVKEMVSQNKNTPSDALEHLSKDENYSIRRGVAGNPNVTENILRALSKDHSSEVRMKVTNNQNTPPDVLKILGNDYDNEVRRGVAGNPHTPPDTLENLSRDHMTKVKMEVAKNSSATEKALDILAKDKDFFIRQFAAGNPNMSGETLEMLAKDEMDGVREAVASNEKTPSNVLDSLAEENSSSIKSCVAKNSGTSMSTLKKLADDVDFEVQNLAKNSIIEKMDSMKEE